MRTIGVLGGIGPQATMDFEAKLHAVSRRLIPQHANQGYPPLLTLYLRHPPVLVGDDGEPRQPLTLDPRVPQAAARLGQWVDLLVVPSNTPHLFFGEIRDAAGCEMLSLVDVTVDELQRRDVSTVGLLGLGIPQVYERRFVERGITWRTAPRALRDRLDEAILRLMEGGETEADRAIAREALAAVRAQDVAATVLGCTEIPLLLGPDAVASDLVDPAALLAEAVVRRALEP